MTTTSPRMPATSAVISTMVLPSPPRVVIRTVQPDREHAVLEMVGIPGHDIADELWQRVEGLLVAGVRYMLVDLSEAGSADAVAGALAEAGRRLEARRGWLCVRQNPMWPVPGGLPEATLTEIFAIYRAFAGSACGWGGRHAG